MPERSLRMKNNHMIVKRLLLYLTFSFLLVWIPTIAYAASGGEYDCGTMQALLAYSMLCPAVGMLLTRWITREGFSLKGKGSLGLAISFADRKWVWYLAAILLPSIYYESGFGLFYLLFPESFNPAQLESMGIPSGAVWMYPIVVITNTCAASVGALGEEAGWRGYMMPKLEELFGIKKAVLIGGVIWGIWHYPAIAMGHNFGTGYWGEPWTGFAAFTLMTIAIGAIQTYLTKKSGSVWPAVFLHAVNNGLASILGLYYDGEKLTGVVAQTTVSNLLIAIPLLILGIIAWVLLCRTKEEKQ